MNISIKLYLKASMSICAHIFEMSRFKIIYQLLYRSQTAAGNYYKHKLTILNLQKFTLNKQFIATIYTI